MEGPLTCIIDLSEYMSSTVLWILLMLPWRSGENQISHIWDTEPKVAKTGLGGGAALPWTSFSTSHLQRWKQPSSTCSSWLLMWRGAGWAGSSGGRRDWLKGL